MLLFRGERRLAEILKIIIELVERDRNRWFIWSPVLFGIGVSIYFALTWEPAIVWLLLPVFCVMCVLVSMHINRIAIILPLLILTIITLGFITPILRNLIVAAPVLQKRVTTDLSGLVLEMSSGAKKQRILLGNLEIASSKAPSLKKIRLTVRTGADHISPGQHVRVKAVLLPPPPPAYPGAYDFQRDFYFKSIGATGYALSKPEIIGESFTSWNLFSSFTSSLRNSVNQHVVEAAPKETAGFSIAIMTGDRGSLSKHVIDNMRGSGLAHLLAISGLHMGMVGGIIFFGFRFSLSLFPTIALKYPIKKWAAVFAMGGLTCYLLLSGMSVSALRAFLMISMVFLAICFDRSALSLRNLAIAALLILIFLPESLLGASFQMSFSAVFCLIAVYERFGVVLITAANTGGMLKRGAYYLCGVAITSLIASTATAPFAIYHFGSFAALGILANLIAVPIMGFWVMPFTLLSFIAMPFGFSELPLELAGQGILSILRIAEFVSSLPSATIRIGSYSTALFVTVTIAALWLFIWRSRLRWAAAVFLFVGMIFQALHQSPDILFADSGKLFVFKTTENTYKIPSRRVDRFERKRWAQMYGVPSFDKIGKIYKTGDPVKCDAVGCLWRQSDNLISYSKNWMSHNADCARANIILSAVPVKRRCNLGGLVIDKFDLWRGGTHAIYFKKEGLFQFENVNSVRGDRPWVPARYRKFIK
ncbi:hypothetical protein A9Q83_12305 [Alphaproteobacteria bacterium 46_93_T64]|nr:hypothetical protein A9Q83_12305 [Alphaproteobacteria bacterium 46_93_T64]